MVYESLLIIELEIVGVPFFETIDEREKLTGGGGILSKIKGPPKTPNEPLPDSLFLQHVL